MLKILLTLVCLTSVVQQSFAYVAKERNVRDISQQDDSFNTVRHSFILLGATGDLSRREIYPSLWYLYRDNLLPKNLRIFGFARKPRTISWLRKQCEPFVTVKPDEEQLYDEFWNLNSYIASTGNEDIDYDNINQLVGQYENGAEGNRIFYLGIPPASFPSVSSQIKRAAMAKNGWTRIAVEKPFGRDSETAEELTQHLTKLFTEDQIYRNDHFLHYEMVQNILALRFGNRLFTPAWNKENIASIEINLRENLGVEGRGSFFDPNNIIRDVMQNHLLQILTLIGMEKPESEDSIRDAKVALLKATKEISMDDVVLGQYVANPQSKDPREHVGYLDDPTVPNDSITSTFALTVLRINNERWNGVPFIIRAGKGLADNETDVVIQFKDIDDNLYKGQSKRNKLIIKAKGNEGLQAKIMSKVPGYSNEIQEITFDFNYEKEYRDLRIIGAYEKLLRDVFLGSQTHFVRSDELKEAWRIFTPILHEIERKQIKPIKYKYGSNGPAEADQMERVNNFFR